MSRRSRPALGLGVAVHLLGCLRSSSGLHNGVGRLPAMGYNTWNDLRCDNISAAAIRELADALVDLGLDRLGYKYLNVDDCWATAYGPGDKLVEDPAAFPEGIGAVADYVHSRGLLFGIYSDRGWRTCALRPASGGLESTHALQFAAWGVDYLKYDSCWATDAEGAAFDEYDAMRDALNATGRPMLYSLCGWRSWYAPRGAGLGNSWRISHDVNSWEDVYVAVRTNEALGQYAGPGGFNDPDMLIGSSPEAAAHLTPMQVQTQFSLWAIMAAPLLIGSRLREMPRGDLETYSNEEIIAVNQDPRGEQGRPVWSNCPGFTPLDSWWIEPWAFLGDVAAPWAMMAALVVVLLCVCLAFAKACREVALTFLFLAFLFAFAVAGMRLQFHPRVDHCQQVWAKPLDGGDVALCLVNWAPDAHEVVCDAACMRQAGVEGLAWVRDSLHHREAGAASELRATLRGGGDSAFFRVKPLQLSHAGMPSLDTIRV